MREYLSREFAIYVSQGCAYNCSFCQAAKGQKEKYRDLDLLKGELTYLASRAKSLEIEKLSFYMSNLDGFQTPKMLLEFAKIVEEVKAESGVNIEFRCLAGIRSFLNAAEIVPYVAKAGMKTIAFGVDGATAEVWASVNKNQNFGKQDDDDLKRAMEAIKLCVENGITAEMLMVFGHPVETEESLKAALDFCQEMADKYGAIPRPHVAKHVIPGADEWKNPANKDIVEQFIENPDYFQALDYTAFASELSHPNAELRALTNKYYKAICEIVPGSTQYIYPNTPEEIAKAAAQGTTIEQLNRGRFDR